MLVHLLADDFYDGISSLWRLQFFNKGITFAKCDKLRKCRNKRVSNFVMIQTRDCYIDRAHVSIFLSID